MTMEDDPTLEDALDGLIDAVNYCENRGMDEHARDISDLYQRVGRDAPEEDWQ
jgi:hypothetical protein